jgi:Ca2+-binding EF-hand superfamily protein
MKLNQLREFVKQIVREEQDYQQLFKHMLDKYCKSITDMSDDDKKKFFNAVDTAYKAKSEGKLRGYNESLPAYYRKGNPKAEQPIIAKIFKLVVAANAGRITGDEFLDQFEPLQKQLKSLKEVELTVGQKKIDTDGDGEIEGSDLAALRAKKEEVKKKK